MSAHAITRCAACGAPLEMGRRVRVDVMAERIDRAGRSYFRMESTSTVCPRCAQAVATLLMRLGEL